MPTDYLYSSRVKDNKLAQSAVGRETDFRYKIDYFFQLLGGSVY